MSSRRRRSSKDKARLSIVSQMAVSHYALTNIEKQFLLFAERGDCASIARIIDEYKDRKDEFNINCLDPLNRSALIIALEKENIDLIQLLLRNEINVNDALLHAINEDYVEGVEVLLQWEEKTHKSGEPYSWENVDKSASGFTADITPVILAAHKNNYEILKLLLDRGAALPTAHDIRCGCDECVTSKEQDSLRHSQSRINAYRAMISPSLICLSSRDPLLTAFELYDELKRLERMETEFRAEYNNMKHTVQVFSTSLLDHVRNSNELDIILNYDPDPIAEPWEPGETQTLERLNLAIKFKLKSFVAHPNVQQLLATIWYKGIPAFRRKTMFYQILNVLQMATMFVVYSLSYAIKPESKKGRFLTNPFVKFICHSASYATFLGLLTLASQRAEKLVLELSGLPALQDMVKEWTLKERGSLFGVVESLIVIYVFSLIWKELRSLYTDGLMEYLSDLWNILDFCANIGYITWISLRLMAYYIVHRELAEGYDPWYPRNKWDILDPHMLSECAFASSMILSFMKLVNIFSVNPHLGPLQISLGRMIIDIIKFFFIYTLVLFAFGCGLNHLLWYFASLEEQKCYYRDSLIPDFEHEDKACTIWRRFANLFETSQSLFWASFGLVDLTAFDLTSIKSFTRFWSLLIFGCYSVINIIVLLNMLIAMMSNSYQIISGRADIEWKFARSKLFISYFEKEDTLPPPFNLMPTIKNIRTWIGYKKRRKSSSMIVLGLKTCFYIMSYFEENDVSALKKKKETSRERADLRYDITMQLLVRRYITAEQKKLEEFAVTEDDIAEVRHDISTLRFELIDIFKQNDFNVPKISNNEMGAHGRKDRLMERRIKKDFQIGMVEGIVNDIITEELKVTNIFSKIAKAIGKQDSKKKDWNDIVRRNTLNRNPIGSTDEAVRKLRQQSVRRYILEYQKGDISKIDPEKLVEYNPILANINPTARKAYCKFKMSLIRQEYDEFHSISRTTSGRSIMRRRSSDLSPNLTKQSSIQEEDVDEEKRSDASFDSIIRPRPASIKIQEMPGILPRSISETIELKNSTADESLPVIFEIPTNEIKEAKFKSKQQDSKSRSSSASTTKTEHIQVMIEPKPASPRSTPSKVLGGRWL